MKPLQECHVLVTSTSLGRFDPRQKEVLATAVARVTYNESGKPLTSAQLQELLPDVDGYIAGLDEIDAAALAAGPNLQGSPATAWALTTSIWRRPRRAASS